MKLKLCCLVLSMMSTLTAFADGLQPSKTTSTRLIASDEVKSADIAAWIKAKGLETNWLKLPKAGSVPAHKTPWADTNWPNAKGNWNWRWNDPVGPQIHTEYKHPTEAQVRKMTINQLKRLSPAEKYSIFIGDFRFALPNALGGDFDSNEAWWGGLCDAWSGAALHYAEPQAVEVKGPSGITVPFGSSDVKALLTEWISGGEATALAGSDSLEADDFLEFAKKKRSLTTYFGMACEDPGSEECNDLSPSTFHLLIANHVGIKREGFIIDVWRNDEFQPRNYFQPIISYESFGMSSTPMPGGKRIRVKTNVTTASDIDDIEADVSNVVTLPQWEPRMVHDPKRSRNVTQTIQFEYEIDLDQKNRIKAGGKWLSAKPDLVFFRKPPTEFSGFWKHLKSIYKHVQ